MLKTKGVDSTELKGEYLCIEMWRSMTFKYVYVYKIYDVCMCICGYVCVFNI